MRLRGATGDRCGSGRKAPGLRGPGGAVHGPKRFSGLARTGDVVPTPSSALADTGIPLAGTESGGMVRLGHLAGTLGGMLGTCRHLRASASPETFLSSPVGRGPNLTWRPSSRAAPPSICRLRLWHTDRMDVAGAVVSVLELAERGTEHGRRALDQLQLRLHSWRLRSTPRRGCGPTRPAKPSEISLFNRRPSIVRTSSP